jgi:hypothetical protein
MEALTFPSLHRIFLGLACGSAYQPGGPMVSSGHRHAGLLQLQCFWG